MKKIITILLLFISISVNGQIIDFNNFDENALNMAIFNEINNYTKSQVYPDNISDNINAKTTHIGDSLILSSVVQEDIMTDTYNHLKNNYKFFINTTEIKGLHKAYVISDTTKNKIINELKLKYNNLNLLNSCLPFICLEILNRHDIRESSYQNLARNITNEWKRSRDHKFIMDINYLNKVVCGVTVYYDEQRRTVYASFVYVSH